MPLPSSFDRPFVGNTDPRIICISVIPGSAALTGDAKRVVIIIRRNRLKRSKSALSFRFSENDRIDYSALLVGAKNIMALYPN